MTTKVAQAAGMPSLNRSLGTTRGGRPTGLGAVRQFDGLARDGVLGVARAAGQGLDGLAVAVARREVLATVHLGRVAAQDRLDLAIALEKRGPVQRRQQAQTGDAV